MWRSTFKGSRLHQIPSSLLTSSVISVNLNNVFLAGLSSLLKEKYYHIEELVLNSILRTSIHYERKENCNLEIKWKLYLQACLTYNFFLPTKYDYILKKGSDIIIWRQFPLLLLFILLYSSKYANKIKIHCLTG